MYTYIYIYILGICVFYVFIGTTFQDDEEELNRQRATAFMVRPSMAWAECINGGIVGINEWVYYHQILPLYIRNGYIN